MLGKHKRVHNKLSKEKKRWTKIEKINMTGNEELKKFHMRFLKPGGFKVGE